MRYPIQGMARIGSIVTVYNQGTVVPSTIYEARVGGSPLSGGQVSPDSLGNVSFYLDDGDYSFPSFFDVVDTLSGYADVSRYDVWHFFSTVSGVTSTSPATPTGITPYTLADMRTRLATFYSLDVLDAQVKTILDECIQTGYEKVVSMTNMHSKESDVTVQSALNTIEYSVSGMGIPTYVGYKSKRLQYLPYDTLRERFNNFGTDWDSGSEDPVYYSLKGFDGAKKTLVIVPAPKEITTIFILCLQNPGVLSDDTDYPLVPQDWQWLVLERAKIERIRFEGDLEFYKAQTQEFVAYIKVMLNRLYPATPEPEHGFATPNERSGYNNWRSNR